MGKQITKLDTKQEADAEEMAALQEDVDLPIKMLSGGVLDGPAIQFKGVGFQYPGTNHFLFKGAEFGIHGKSRIVLVGENGNGKTTSVKLLLGELEATLGKLERNRGCRFSLVNQH